MPFTHRITRVYQTDAGTVINVTESVTGTNQGVDIDATVNAGATVQYDVMMVPDNVQSLMFWSDQPADVKTNDATTPLDTIPLKATVPVVWTLNSPFPIPFQLGTPVTKLVVTNNGPTAANVKIRVLSN
jgi:hypothetical protein